MAHRKRKDEVKKSFGRTIIWTFEIIEEHGKELVEWAYKTDTWRIKLYFIERKISLSTVEEWIRCSPEFKQCWKEAQGILLEKFHIMVGLNTINHAYAYRMLRIIDKEYNSACIQMAYEEKKAETRAQFEAEKESGVDNIIRIVFEDRPSNKEISSEYIPIP